MSGRVSDQERQLLAAAVVRFGIDEQLSQTIEECAELICAIRHHQRGRPNNLAEEIADVEIMLQQLRLVIGNAPIDQARAQKLARLRSRLEMGQC